MCLKKKKPTVKPGQGLDENGNPIRADNAISDWDRSKYGKEESEKGQFEPSGTDGGDNDGVVRPRIVDDHEEGIDDDLNGSDETEERVTVPLTITMIIITLYILIGAVIFNQFEGWTLIQSGYFCYITLSTIGMILKLKKKIKLKFEEYIRK